MKTFLILCIDTSDPHHIGYSLLKKSEDECETFASKDEAEAYLDKIDCIGYITLKVIEA